jgi:GGDEF domain-containing protein
MARLDENMSRSKYTFSAGHIRWEPNETFDQAYARADKAMYKVKQAYHNLNS